MIKTQQLIDNKKPTIKIDKSLEKLRGQNFFPEKLAKANEVITRVGLPKV